MTEKTLSEVFADARGCLGDIDVVGTMEFVRPKMGDGFYLGNGVTVCGVSAREARFIAEYIEDRREREGG